MIVKMSNKEYQVIVTISELSKEGKSINPNSIALKANISWETAKKYLNNLLNIKEKKC